MRARASRPSPDSCANGWSPRASRWCRPSSPATRQSVSKIRQILLDPATGALADRTESLLYAADKAEHVETVVKPALARGEVVITDRYVDSTLAYQGAGRALDVGRSRRSLAGRPETCVRRDRGARPGAERRAGRFEERDRIEGESLEFHERVRVAFLLMAQAAPEHYLVLDARAPVEEIAAAVRARIEPLLDQVAR